MPRKIGYGNFTPARQAALKKAQLESARKRRKFHSETRSRRKKGLIIAGAAAAAGIGVYAIAKNRGNSEYDRKIRRLQDEKEERDIEKAAKEAQEKEERIRKWGEPPSESDDVHTRLRKRSMAIRNMPLSEQKRLAGDPLSPVDSEEQYAARMAIYGESQVLGTHSKVHEGRPEIFPGLPAPELLREWQRETANPSYDIADNNPGEDYVVLYHRTSGGKDLDGEAAKQSILKNQSLRILNRDERRAGANPNDYNEVWLSDRLNDSNTRGAFGETVVQIKFPKDLLHKVSRQTFGKLSPTKETWASMHPSVIDEVVKRGYKFEDVPPEMITPRKDPGFKLIK